MDITVRLVANERNGRQTELYKVERDGATSAELEKVWRYIQTNLPKQLNGLASQLTGVGVLTLSADADQLNQRNTDIVEVCINAAFKSLDTVRA